MLQAVKSMEDEQLQLAEQFKTFPNIDPVTYTYVKIPSKQYRDLLSLYGDP